MPGIRLRPFRQADLAVFAADEQEPGGFEFYGFRPTNGIERRYAENGLIGADLGNLVVDLEGTGPIGDVGWFAVHHGPPAVARALNVGIGLFPAHRGHGHGTDAQRLLAERLFADTVVERLEASTDVENIAEQRSLTKAGFTREGVLRHGQWRAGGWHDLVVFSRLRGD